jgi:hypothetical protein
MTTSKLFFPRPQTRQPSIISHRTRLVSTKYLRRFSCFVLQSRVPTFALELVDCQISWTLRANLVSGIPFWKRWVIKEADKEADKEVVIKTSKNIAKLLQTLSSLFIYVFLRSEEQ